MDIIINSTYSEDGHNGMEMTCGKTTAMVFKGRSGQITTICKNASHNAWKGMGRTFRTWEDAIDGYRSGAMKAMIGHAANEIG